VNILDPVPEPEALYTTTLTVPELAAAVVPWIVVLLSTANPVTGTPPICAAVAPVKFEPEIITVVPPVRGPDDGLIVIPLGGELVAATWNDRLPVFVNTPPSLLSVIE
jgi:hypothetical protein